MDLFGVSGIELRDAEKGSRPGRAVTGRRLRIPLLKHKVVANALKTYTFDFTEAQVQAATRFAQTAKKKDFKSIKETAVRPLFAQQILVDFLGYKDLSLDSEYSISFEVPLGRGAVDVALGSFGNQDQPNLVVAPFELKGPSTADLDAIMPGRGRSPVQQAWEYANDAPGCKWVLVSNCVELRLYAFGRGRDAYEWFDLRRLDEQAERERLWLLLSAARLLSGATEQLLRDTDTAYKTITDDLYKQYSDLRDDLISFLTEADSGPRLELATALEPAQKILDRIIFISFAQRMSLLPDRVLERAMNARNEFRPEPIWKNIVQLFQGVAKGDDRLDVWPYNGGLFEFDQNVDTLLLPDTLTRGLGKLGEWDYRDDVPVTLLGHLFEQSITDLERIRAKARGEQPPKLSKRKREGVVYTPDMVTRFLVSRTVGATLAERFNKLLEKIGKAAPTGEEPIFLENEKDLERQFWIDYAASVRSLRILDPACGSGAFLVAAFDLLAAEYKRIADHLHALGVDVDFDPLDEIVTRNLYGVDINGESVEITRLALWLKTARPRRKLQNLSDTIKVGDSLLGHLEGSPHPLSWDSAFDGIPSGERFDVVLGNPPYVRSESISKLKPRLRERYEVFDSGADLYCYFYELGVSLLKPGGKLGFITSSGFFKTKFGGNLRAYLTRNGIIECGVDFGDAQIFEDVTTYPAILVIRREAAETPYSFSFLNYTGKADENLAFYFQHRSFTYPAQRLARSRWHFEPQTQYQVRDRIEEAAQCSLGEITVPVSGIKTGLTEAFIITRKQREELIAAEPACSDVLRPWTVGDDLDRWMSESSSSYLVFFPKGWTKSEFGEMHEDDAWAKLSERYPPLTRWLEPYAAKARERSDQGDFWWELRACDYYDLFEQEIIIYPEMSQGPKFSMKARGSVSNNKTFLMPNSNYAMLGLMNSRVVWFSLIGICTALRGGKWRLEARSDFLRDLPFIRLSNLPEELADLARSIETLTADKTRRIHQFGHRIFDFAKAGQKVSISRKLQEWWGLGFAEFRGEIKKAFRRDIELRERAAWEQFFEDESAAVRTLNFEIARQERAIDNIAYGLFGLSSAQREIVEEAISRHY